jgi:hypothetical protein
VYFVPGDRERLDRIRAAQAGLTHPDERFMLDAPTPNWTAHRSVTSPGNVNDVLSGIADYGGRRQRVFFKPLSGVDLGNARGFQQDSVVDLGINEIAAWRLAAGLGQPWDGLVAPAVWLDPPGATDIRESGPFILGMAGQGFLPEPGTGFDQLISDAAFFDSLAGSQDRHDLNLRAHSSPPGLGLIDHGYCFARPGDYHNRFPTAGFFLRLRFGQRRFPLPNGAVLNFSGVGVLDPALAPHEQAAIARLKAEATDLLGVAQLLPDDRAAALRDRVDHMGQQQRVLAAGDF